MASGLLANALTRQLLAQQRASEPVRIDVSFRSKSGEYCRTFSMRSPAVAGLACHAADGWRRLDVLSGTESHAVTGEGYRQASSSLPPAVVNAVTHEMSEPLDARAEAAARRHGWQPSSSTRVSPRSSYAYSSACIPPRSSRLAESVLSIVHRIITRQGGTYGRRAARAPHELLLQRDRTPRRPDRGRSTGGPARELWGVNPKSIIDLLMNECDGVPGTTVVSKA